MRIYQLNPDSTRQKTAIFYALNAGYRFKLTDSDGTATVTNPEGDIYHIHNWQCDCADASNKDGGSYTLPNNRHVCKHILWLSQLYPCSNCKGYMILRVDHPWKFFQCCTPACYTMEAFQKVKVDRQQVFRFKEQEADVIKTHIPTPTPDDIDEILARAANASTAVFGD